MELGSPKGRALTHCHPDPKQEDIPHQKEGRISPRVAKHLNGHLDLLSWMPSSWAPGYSPANEVGYSPATFSQ